jgi:hypothetical protein
VHYKLDQDILPGGFAASGKFFVGESSGEDVISLRKPTVKKAKIKPK